MAIKRLSKEELISTCIEIFYDHMASGNDLIIKKELVKCNEKFPTPMDLLCEGNRRTLKENENRLRMFCEANLDKAFSSSKLEIIREQIDFLLQERRILENLSMDKQKELYKRTKNTGYSRSIARIPLNKKINSYYDDLILEVLFYDNISLPIGVYSTYSNLSTSEEKKEFIKGNTEITHIGLALTKTNNHVATFVLLGDFDHKEKCMLDSTYIDFSKLSLAQTMSIPNNDLRQFLQARIDMDKEKLTLKAEKMIGNDNYRIYETSMLDIQAPNWLSTTFTFDPNHIYYIRYVCPSTGRVYYNTINISNLSISKYYKENDFESYIDAWWSINNLGRDPNGKAMIRC